MTQKECRCGCELLECSVTGSGATHSGLVGKICGKLNQMLPPNPNPGDGLMPFGVYAGRLLKEIYLENPEYFRWAASFFEGELQHQMTHYLALKDSRAEALKRLNSLQIDASFIDRVKGYLEL